MKRTKKDKWFLAVVPPLLASIPTVLAWAGGFGFQKSPGMVGLVVASLFVLILSFAVIWEETRP